MPETYRTIMIEDSVETAERVRHLLVAEDDFVPGPHYATGRAALNALGADSLNPPDLILADLGLPDMHGAEVIRLVRERMPETKIVAFTVFEDEANILQAIMNGANGYLLKDTPEDRLLAELRVVMMGGAALTPRIATRILKDHSQKDSSVLKGHDVELGDRAKQILNLISLGFTYQQIAANMSLSPNTVRNHIQKIYRVLEVNSSTAAVHKGRLMGLLE